MHRVVLTLVKKDGILIPATAIDKAKLELLTKTIPEGKLVETYLEEQGEFNHTLAQIAKFHAVARDIAQHVGESVEDMKLYIKKEAGLTTTDETGALVYKSLKDCTRSELSVAIQVALRLSGLLNIPEHGTATT